MRFSDIAHGNAGYFGFAILFFATKRLKKKCGIVFANLLNYETPVNLYSHYPRSFYSVPKNDKLGPFSPGKCIHSYG
jgi:hypothetical protein